MRAAAARRQDAGHIIEAAPRRGSHDLQGGTLSLDLTQLTPEQRDQLSGLLATMQTGKEAERKRKARKKDTVKYLSEEQLDRFFDVITNPRDIAMFRLMYHRGLRASEV